MVKRYFASYRVVEALSIRLLLNTSAIKKEAEKETLIKNIRQAVKNGLSDNYIKKKYNTSYSTICKYACDIKAEKRRIQEQEKQALMEKVWRMRADGMLVKDIAEALGLHRTTITEYCKKIHGNTESA